ncbi:hypothetical protein [[Eubacterium] cellulosolvens]
MEEKQVFTAIIENTPVEVINIIEQELATMIGDGCAHMFVQAIYDDIVKPDENLSKDHVFSIYDELKKELKGLLGELGLVTLDRKINYAIKSKLGLINFFNK